MEEMDMKMKKYHILISVCMAAVWIFLINRFAGIVFETNDDRMITEIFSGAMTGAPEAHAYYVDYILGFILSSLYSITADVPWYGGMLALFQLLCWLFCPGVKTKGMCFSPFCAAASCMGRGFTLYPVFSSPPRLPCWP